MAEYDLTLLRTLDFVTRQKDDNKKENLFSIFIRFTTNLMSIFPGEDYKLIHEIHANFYPKRLYRES